MIFSHHKFHQWSFCPLTSGGRVLARNLKTAVQNFEFLKIVGVLVFRGDHKIFRKQS